MKRLLLALLLILPISASAQFNGCPSGFCAQAPVGGGCTPGAAATTFLARTSVLNPNETTATCLFINDLVIAGIITGNLTGARGCGTVAENIYFLATKDKTTAFLNICGTSFGLTETATVTCTVDLGCAGNGSGGFADTGWVPSINCANCTQDKISLFTYSQTSRVANTSITIGSSGNGGFTLIAPFTTGNNVQWDLNDGTFPTAANSDSRGALVAVRTLSNATQVYRNGSTTPIGTSAAVSVALSSGSVFLSAFNNNGTPGSFNSDVISCAGVFRDLTATQAVAINNACNHAMTVYGSNIYP